MAHPYCRTCGSRINNKDVCPHCGCDPVKGHNYCYDCGTSTIAEAIMCVHCGASLQKRFPAVLAILISVALAVAAAVAGYFIFWDSEPSEKIAEAIEHGNNHVTVDTGSMSPGVKKLNDVNQIPSEIIKGRDAVSKVIKNMPLFPKNETVPEQKPEPEQKTQTVKNVEIKKLSDDKPAPVRTGFNSFSAGEARNYGAICTYFQGRSRNSIVFFTSNVYGYIKLNGKVYALQGVQKGNDIARFSGGGYEVTVEILGLAGNEREWLAEAMLVVYDSHRTLLRQKIYSTCTDF